MIYPDTDALEGVRGGKLDVRFLLFADDDETVPYPIVGTVQVEFDGVATLSEGDAEMVVDAAGGSVTVHLTAEQTARAPAPLDWRSRVYTARYRLVVRDGDGEPDYPATGPMVWRLP